MACRFQTPRLVLRAAREEDAEALFDAFKDPEVMKYWSTLPHDTIDKTRDWVKGMTRNSQNGLSDFIICLNDSSETAIGKIGVWQENEIGLLLNRQHWGQGLASEALESILPYLFNNLDISLLMADTDPRNAASIGLLKKHGFVDDRYEEKTLEIDGKWVDSLYMKLERQRWQQFASKEIDTQKRVE